MIGFFRKKQKVLLNVLVLLHFFVMSTLPASAGLFSGPKIPSPSSVFSDMEKRYHLDTGSIQSQGESFNTADNKKPAPEVSLFFNPSDPKPGEKITAKAFPMYFSTNETDLYYTWYLKRVECNIGGGNLALCDSDGDGRITVNDWKVDAAKIIAQNGFDKAEASYGSDTDNDGYKARYGGDNRVGTNDHCYVDDPKSGKKYELGESGNVSFDCPSGTIAVCLQGDTEVNPIDIVIPGDGGSDPTVPVPPTPGTSGPAFEFVDGTVCHAAGLPVCSSGGAACGVGVPYCVPSNIAETESFLCSSGSPLTSCSSGGGITRACQHLFPIVPGFTNGDGIFGANEEEFWGTNPADSDTADNGNKDEANTVGLSQSSITWNYSAGDQIGVAIEGTSMFATKYDDSSAMIMWAFSKKDCPITLATGLGSFVESIKGYTVTMLSADFDLNRCLERNLVDPTQGGQATILDIGVSATPDTPINDESVDATTGLPEGGGDFVVAQASVGNPGRSLSEILFEWDVELSNNAQFRNSGSLISANVTSDLQALKLLGNVKGAALDSVRLKLDILNNATTLLAGNTLGSYLIGGIGYLRFTVKASENFSSGAVRKGKSDVVVKFTSTGQKISAYKVNPVLIGSTMQVALSPDIICNDDPLDRVACRIIKNEVIGLRVDPTNLTNFQWTINGAELLCNRLVVSQDCEEDAFGNITIGQQNFVNFFPVTGEAGETYTVTLTANDTVTGKTVALARTFHVIAPVLSIESADLGTAWPKLVGQYKDVDGAASLACSGGFCSAYSDSVFEGFSGEDFSFRAAYLPNFLALGAPPRQWTVDNILINEAFPMGITFSALKSPPDVYNIALATSITQSQDVRRALRDIWNISPLESTEIHFSASIQVELKESGFAQGTLQGTKKYLAAISSYIPTSLMFSFRVLLSAILVLFTARFVLTLLPEQAIFSSSGKRK